ncbi:site-specific DNA-methyltransferase [Chlorobium limicola]
MDKLKMHSPNLTQENIRKIMEVFPNCVTEIRDERKAEGGRLKDEKEENSSFSPHPSSLRYAVDFDQLRQELSDSIVEGPQERYHLDWPGKREALLTANAPIAKTLRPYREESVDFDTTKNLFIEGDNLDALKLLQETYLGKVKMIYIDPPYNTGNDFIYEDDFAENTEEFLKRTNQKDVEGKRLVANTESNGRFHSDWLSMIYPRLKLGRNLLSDDGVIFISIDDNEVAQLRKICDEVFGEGNFVAQLVWERAYSPKNDAKYISNSHDYVLMYVKQIYDFSIGRLPRTAEANARYQNPDNDPRGVWKPSDMSVKTYNEECDYPITTPAGRVIEPPAGRCWSLSKKAFLERLKDNRIYFGSEGNSVPSIKRFLSELKYDGMAPISIMPYKDVGHSQEGAKEVTALLEAGAFDGPKPIRLLRRLLTLANLDNDSVTLDFFSGSATTAHAVMQLNAEDGGNRKFIMVQLSEACDEKSEAFKAGYKTIAEIGKERIRRAGKKILEGECHEGWNKDVGFRVLKLDTSNMADVYYAPDAINQTELFDAVDNVKPDRTPEDLLFQVLLDWGVDLTLPIRKESIQGKMVFFVAENSLVACFDIGITEAFVRELAGYKPLRVVFRDNGFESDAVKINAEQIFRQLSPETEVKAI